MAPVVAGERQHGERAAPSVAAHALPQLRVRGGLTPAARHLCAARERECVEEREDGPSHLGRQVHRVKSDRLGHVCMCMWMWIGERVRVRGRVSERLAPLVARLVHLVVASLAMPLRLYWFPLSPPSRLVHFFCLAAGIEVELVLVDLFKGEQRLPSYLEINPDGKVPALDDDGFRMNEACCSIPCTAGAAT